MAAVQLQLAELDDLEYSMTDDVENTLRSSGGSGSAGAMGGKVGHQDSDGDNVEDDLEATINGSEDDELAEYVM